MKRCGCRQCRARETAQAAAERARQYRRFAAIVRDGFTNAERAHYAAIVLADCTTLGAILETVQWQDRA
jgi:hypothetical protein